MPARFSLSPPLKEERGEVRRHIIFQTNPLTPTRAPLGRGEGTDGNVSRFPYNGLHRISLNSGLVRVMLIVPPWVNYEAQRFFRCAGARHRRRGLHRQRAGLGAEPPRLRTTSSSATASARMKNGAISRRCASPITSRRTICCRGCKAARWENSIWSCTWARVRPRPSATRAFSSATITNSPGTSRPGRSPGRTPPKTALRLCVVRRDLRRRLGGHGG